MNEKQRAPRRSYLLPAGLILAVVLVGFARTFYLRGAFFSEALPSYLILHGTALTAWFVIFFIQVILVAKRRVDVHKRLGIVGAVLVPIIIITSLITVAVPAAPIIDQNPYAGIGNISAVLGFGILVGYGIRYRRKPALHRRLMLLSSIQITGPAIDRIAQIPSVNRFLEPILPDALGPTQIAFAILGTMALLAMLFISDIRSRGRPHAATVLGTVCIFLLGPALGAVFIFSGAWAFFVQLVT